MPHPYALFASTPRSAIRAGIHRTQNKKAVPEGTARLSHDPPSRSKKPAPHSTGQPENTGAQQNQRRRLRRNRHRCSRPRRRPGAGIVDVETHTYSIYSRVLGGAVGVAQEDAKQPGTRALDVNRPVRNLSARIGRNLETIIEGVGA